MFYLCIGIIILSLLPSCSTPKKSESFIRLPQIEGKAPQAIAKSYQAEYHGLT
jgi:oligopeptidase B